MSHDIFPLVILKHVFYWSLPNILSNHCASYFLSWEILMVILNYSSFHVFFTYCISQKITCQVFCNLMAHSLRTHDELISFSLFTAPTEKATGNQSILVQDTVDSLQVITPQTTALFCLLVCCRQNKPSIPIQSQNRRKIQTLELGSILTSVAARPLTVQGQGNANISFKAAVGYSNSYRCFWLKRSFVFWLSGVAGGQHTP